MPYPMPIDPRKLRPVDLCRLLNSTPLGEVINERQLYRHRSRAGFRIGDGKHIDLPRYVAWLVHERHAPRPEAESDGDPYEALKDRARTRNASISLAGRDIGPLPEIEDIERRRRCRFSLKAFCKSYNPDAFHLGWSSDQIKVIARIEEAVLQGALYAFALPRGGGKTTICRMACLWAISFGHCRYVFIIGANDTKAKENLDAIKVFIRFLPEYAADFPEIAFPVRRLEGIANRASGQLCEGEPTLITWNNDRVVLPTVPPPPNWPDDWPAGRGRAVTAGSIISVSGLTGDGIRGSLHTLTTGEMVRPDFVLLDDPQTDESARSAAQNDTREKLIAGAVLGMAGPGAAISAVMPCTVIDADDMISRILDRSKHPLWRGERGAMLRSMPANMAAWDAYFDIYRQCALREPPDFREANEYYSSHRAELDEGAEPSWPARKLPEEVSAVQHAMNLYCRGPRVFFAEYQNEPLRDELSDVAIQTVEEIAAKTNGIPAGTIPVGGSHLTMFIDVQQALLFYCICAWEEDFTGYVVEYGTWPDQGRQYFTLRDARRTLADATEGAGLEGSIYAGLESLTVETLGREWPRDDGAMLRIERCLVDANWGSSTDVVYQFCRQSKHAAIMMPSHGRFVGASSVPFSEYKRKPGDRVGHNWRVPNVRGKRAVRHVVFDTNYWKSFIHARLAVAMGDKGCLSLFGRDPFSHRLLAEHLTAEYRVRTEGRGRTVDEWKMRPDRSENHWFDCLVGCAVAASIQGAVLFGTEGRPVTGRRRLKLSEIRTRKR